MGEGTDGKYREKSPKIEGPVLVQLLRLWVVFYFLLLLAPLVALAEHPASCNAYFSPTGQLANRLIDLIEKEDKSVKVAIYSLTHAGIAKALVRAKNRGVKVEVLVDPFSVKKHSSLHFLEEADIPLFVWDHNLQMQGSGARRSSKRTPLMHDKFCVFGDHLVWTGSFNFTNDGSSRHKENAVTIESRTIAIEFNEQFEQMKLYEARRIAEYLQLHPHKENNPK